VLVLGGLRTKRLRLLGWYAAAAFALSGSAAAQPVTVSTAAVGTVRTSEPLLFDGRVQAQQHADVSNRIDGVVSAIHFSAGQSVEKGALLFELAPESYEAAVQAARADLARAEAELRQKRFVLAQQGELRTKGVASELRYQEVANDEAIAQAEVAAAQAALQLAELELSRTRIVAPIGGRIGEPLVALGAFVEAESERPLARIVQLDPIRVVYQVPYEQRLQTLSQSGGSSVAALLGRVTVQLTLPGGEPYPHSAHPEFSTAEVDPGTGMIEVAASFPNPDEILLPGLSVRVTSFVEGVPQILSTIPREAARVDAQGQFVLLVQPSGIIERRSISILGTKQERLLVSGVFAGETVVADATFQAIPGTMVIPASPG
jgi:membrane fusion protein (multidrug efflux system)